MDRRKNYMEIEVKRKVKKEVEETVVMELQKYYVVRVVKDTGSTKTCVHEVDCGCFVTDECIAQAIIEAKEKYKSNVNLFATVAENYRLVEREKLK